MSTQINAAKKKNISRPLVASPGIIRANFRRLFGTFTKAAMQIKVTRRCIRMSIEAGRVSHYIAGKLCEVGIDPSELTKKPKNGAKP